MFRHTHTEENTDPTTPTARRRPLRRLGSRVAAVALVALTGGMGMVAIGASPAMASNGLPDCIHGVQGATTALTTALPVNGTAMAGLRENQWLYHWNAYYQQWRYTGVSIGARSYAGGVWLSGGRNIDSMDFFLRVGSGHYLVLEQIIQPSGAQITFWQPYYRNVPGSGYTRYCTA